MFAQALNETIQHFGLSAREISLKTGVTEATISNLRSGNSDAKLSTFENLIGALPPEAKNYMFFKALLSDKVSSKDIHNFLTAIAVVIRDQDIIQQSATLTDGSPKNVSFKTKELVLK